MTEREDLKRAYLHAKKSFRKELRRSKRKEWRRFGEEGDKVDKWGLHAKVARGKNTSRMAAESFGREQLGLTAAGLVLLEDAFPPDEMASDGPEHTAIRRAETIAVDGMTTPWTVEVSSVICKLRAGRAPGMDRVEAAVVKACEDVITPYIHQFSADCLKVGYFPATWKKSAFLKTGRPANQLSSYRMISFYRKVLEHLILAKLRMSYIRVACRGVVLSRNS